MKVILAGATGMLGVPITEQLLAAGHEVVGITRTSAGVQRLNRLGATALVADVMDRAALLAAAGGVQADAVMHQLTALKKAPAGHRGNGGDKRLENRGHDAPARSGPRGRRPAICHPIDRLRLWLLRSRHASC